MLNIIGQFMRMRLIKKEAFLLLLALFFGEILIGQDIVINELVSSNDSVIQDIDGDYSDWIELHNLKNYDISITDYTLSDDSSILDKWVFPDMVIPANAYLLIFASDKDKFQDNELHTNFKISQSGESLFLSNKEGEIVSEVGAIHVPTDHSYARIANSGEILVISDTPTPNASNSITNGVYASHSSGFYSSRFELELINLNEEQEIFYTLNGGIPTVNSSRYLGPITIANNTQTPYSISAIPTTPLTGPSRLEGYIWKEPTSVYKANVIRFAAFKEGLLQGEIHSKTFFVDPEIGERYEYPVVSFVTDSANLFDYEKGIYVPGKVFDEEGFNWWPAGNYHNTGQLWERDVHISYFSNTGELGFETDAGMRIRGFGSASNPQKSLNLYFRSDYGLSKIDYPIFPNSTAKKHKRLIFRNSGNDFTYSHFKDPMLHDIMRGMDLEIQDFEPAIVFINGEYWGIHNMREKYDEYYFEYKYGIDDDDINLLEICGGIEEGDNADYIELYQYIEQNDLSIAEHYNYVSDRVDISNFIDFQIAEIYFANFDWPCNNFKIWKDNQPDSKWRYMIYDLDLAFGYSDVSTYATESMEHATSPDNNWPHCECSNLFFRSLLDNDAFKEQFLDRFAYHLDNTFCPTEIEKTIDKFEKLYANEIGEHIARWGHPRNIDVWKNEVSVLREFSELRPDSMISNLKAFFELDVYEAGCKEDDDGGIVEESDDFTIYPNPNGGDFFISNSTGNTIVNGRIVIINTTGQVVFEKDKVSIAKGQAIQLKHKNLLHGVYFLLLEYGDEIYRQKNNPYKA